MYLRLSAFRACGLFSCALLLAGSTANSTVMQLSAARDRQDLSALTQNINQLQAAANQSNTPGAQYLAALASSYAAEVAMELRDKKKSASFAESGMDYAKKAVEEKPNDAEYHRLLGQLCGQVIPANPLFGAIKYGQCARDELNKALELNNNFAMAYVTRGVGNYYLPAAMGGGPGAAVKDFDKALAIDGKLSDAYLWKGIALKKENQDAEARAALERCLQLDPNRLWAKQELDKMPGH